MRSTCQHSWRSGSILQSKPKVHRTSSSILSKWTTQNTSPRPTQETSQVRQSTLSLTLSLVFINQKPYHRNSVHITYSTNTYLIRCVLLGIYVGFTIASLAMQRMFAEWITENKLPQAATLIYVEDVALNTFRNKLGGVIIIFFTYKLFISYYICLLYSQFTCIKYNVVSPFHLDHVDPILSLL